MSAADIGIFLLFFLVLSFFCVIFAQELIINTICRAIVDIFGGEFFMDSDGDQKTVASFWFPCELKDVYKDI